MVVFVLLFPLLIYDHYYPVSSNTQAVYSVIIILLSVCVVYFITKKYGSGFSNKEQIAGINSTQVEVVRVKTNRAIKREDPEDFGIAFYIDVIDNGQRKTLYLWGQYLYEWEADSIFPNTEFEFIRKVGSDEFIDFKPTGQYFREEKTLPPFGKEVWDSGNYPVNGQLLDQTIDSIN